jgi:hypothetical protein
MELANHTERGVDGTCQFSRAFSNLIYSSQCTNASNHQVASYSLKVPGEPEYDHSSGCVLTIEEAYPHLAAGMPVFQLFNGTTLIKGVQRCWRP